MDNKIEEEIKKITKLAHKNGILTERNRIMEEILLANLSLGIWDSIKDIINPPKEKRKNKYGK